MWEKSEKCEKKWVCEKKWEKCEKKWEMWEKVRSVRKVRNVEKVRCVRKSEKIVRKSEICEEKVREMCEKVRGMGKWAMRKWVRTVWWGCKKKWEVLKNEMCEKKGKLACVLGSLHMLREVQHVLLIT